MTAQRLVSPVLEAEGDEELERSLRPRTLDDFIGQERLREQLAIAAPVPEHDIADDDQAPTVAELFKRQIDRAAGSSCLPPGCSPGLPLAICKW